MDDEQFLEMALKGQKVFRPTFSFKGWLFRGWTPMYLAYEFSKERNPRSGPKAKVWIKRKSLGDGFYSPFFVFIIIALELVSSIIPLILHLPFKFFVIEDLLKKGLYRDYYIRKLVQSDNEPPPSIW